MSAKRKKLTDAERQERRAKTIRNRTNKALADLGIDVEYIPANDREAISQAERNVHRLRSIRDKMQRQTSPTEPTAGRRAHSPTEPRPIEVSPAEAKAHAFDWIIEDIRDKLTTRQYGAAERLRACHDNMQPRSAVVDTTGAGGASDPTSRLAITETQERATRQFQWVMGRLEPTFASIVENFVLEEVPEGKERCLTFEEWGTKVAKFGRDRNYGAGVMAAILACSRLASLWHAHDAMQREQCAKTDKLMRSDIGRRAGAQGWIVALWAWCHANRRLPAVQGEMDAIRAKHDEQARELRRASPVSVERFNRRRDKLTAIAFREFDDGRVRVAS